MDGLFLIFFENLFGYRSQIARAIKAEKKGGDEEKQKERQKTLNTKGINKVKYLGYGKAGGVKNTKGFSDVPGNIRVIRACSYTSMYM